MKERRLEVMCAWKRMEQEEDSTTFSDVKRVGERHGLYKCIGCYGYVTTCKDYRRIK